MLEVAGVVPPPQPASTVEMVTTIARSENRIVPFFITPPYFCFAYLVSISPGHSSQRKAEFDGMRTAGNGRFNSNAIAPRYQSLIMTLDVRLVKRCCAQLAYIMRDAATPLSTVTGNG